MSSKRAWYADYTLQIRDPFAGMSLQLVALIKAELTEGEEILWMEQPRVESIFMSRFPFVIYLYVALFAFNTLPRLFGLLTGNGTNIDWFSVAFGVISFPLGMLGGWFCLSLQFRHSLYIVTNHRLVCFNSSIFSFNRVKSYYFNYQVKPEYIKLKKRGKGRSDLAFAKENSSEFYSEATFYGIRRAHEVQQLIQQRLAQNTENPVADLPLKLQQILKAELALGENVLWASLSDPYTVKRQQINRWGLSKVGLIIGFPLAAAGFVTFVVGVATNQSYFWVGLSLLVVSMLLLGWLMAQSFKKTVNYNVAPGYIAYLITGQRILRVTVESSGREQIDTYYYTQASVPPRIVRTSRTAKTANLHLQDSLSRPIPRTVFSLLDVSEPDKAEQLLKQLTLSGTL